jgi:GTP-binding protein
VRRKLARTSAAPGKTRLANVYRVARGSAPAIYMVDLPGYGYARREAGQSREAAAALFEQLTAEYFGLAGQGRRERAHVGAVLLVDARHPGLQSDRDAWRWLQQTVDRRAAVATKIDKLTRGERIRAVTQFESVFETSVLPVSAVTGEGLDELWRTIERLASSNPGATAAPRPRRPKN